MSREAMKQALEALELYQSRMSVQMFDEAVRALRQALQTDQEPVAWANSFDLQNFDMKVRTGPDLQHTVPLYTAPPKRDLTCVCGAVWEGETMVHPPRKREWVGLPESAFAAMTLQQVSAMKYAELVLKEKSAKALVAAEKEKQIIDILERLQERNESHTYYKYAINVIKGEI